MKTVTWQKALILLFQGKVEVVEFHALFVRSAYTSFRLPSILRLKKYVSPSQIARLKFSRENILIRDNYTCQYCAKRFHPKDLTLDHVIPASKNGRRDWNNMVAACRGCNHRKANRTPLGAGMPLLREPRTPNWLPLVRQEFRMEIVPDEWKPYLIRE